MLSKAKTLTGEWVTGDHITGVGRKKGKHFILPHIENLAYAKPLGCHPLDGYEINPSTLCQQVPTKDWFVGDEIKWGGNFLVVGYVVFDEKSMSYKIENEQGRMIITDNWNPTGKNKHDDE